MSLQHYNQSIRIEIYCCRLCCHHYYLHYRFHFRALWCPHHTAFGLPDDSSLLEYTQQHSSAAKRKTFGIDAVSVLEKGSPSCPDNQLCFSHLQIQALLAKSPGSEAATTQPYEHSCYILPEHNSLLHTSEVSTDVFMLLSPDISYTRSKKGCFNTVETDHWQKEPLQYHEDRSPSRNKATERSSRKNEGKQLRPRGLDKMLKHDSIKRE